MTDDNDHNDDTITITEGELDDLVEQKVEQQLEQRDRGDGISRRDLLATGAGGLLGAGILKSSTDGVSAGSQSVGTVGSASSPVDIVAEDIMDPDGNTAIELGPSGNADVGGVLTAGTVETGGYRFPDQNWILLDQPLSNTDGIALTYEGDGFGASRDDIVLYDDSAATIHLPRESGWTVDGNSNDFTNIGSVSTEEVTVKNEAVQAALDGLIVPVGPGLGVSDAINPSNTTTPVQDAHDLVGVGGGLLFPPARIKEQAKLVFQYGSQVWRGWGNATKIEFTDLSAPGVDYQGVNFTDISGIVFDGSDPTNRTAPVWQYTVSNPLSQNFGWVRFINGSDPVIDTTLQQPFSSDWHHVSFFGGNAGTNKGRNIHGPLGVGHRIGSTYLTATDGFTGLDIGGFCHIGPINVGGNIHTAVDHSGAANLPGVMGPINYETGQTFSGAAVRLGGAPQAALLPVNIATGTPDYHVELYDPGSNPPKSKRILGTQGSRAVAMVNLADGLPSNAAFASYYFGDSSNVADNSGTATGNFRCLSTAGSGLG